MEQTFSIREVLRFGWEKFKAHSGVLLQGTLTVFAINISSSVVQQMHLDPFLHAVLNVVFAIVNIVVGVGLTSITLKIVRGEPTVYRDILPPSLVVWKYLVASFLVSLVIGGVGLVAILVGFAVVAVISTLKLAGLTILATGVLITAGLMGIIYLAIRYSFVVLPILDGAKIIESIHRSAILTQGIKWKLLGFMLVMALINLAGALCLLVGLLVSVPVTTVALSKVYDLLKHRVEAKA